MGKKANHLRKVRKECWDMNYALFKWLNEHCRTYIKDAGKIVDLEYYKFDYNGKTYTQLEIIKLLIEKTDVIIKLDDWDDEYIVVGNEIIDLWRIVWPTMWW